MPAAPTLVTDTAPSRSRRTPGPCAALLGAALLLACGCQTPREKYEAASRETLALLPSLANLAREAAPITEAAVDGLKAVTDLSLKYKRSNALLIHLEELSNPTVRLALPVRLNHRSPTVDVATALNLVQPVAPERLDARYDPSCDAESPDWQLLGEARYVLVVRTSEARDARLLGDRTFAEGSWRGEVLVYELRSKRLLGGFPLSGGNHAWVQTRLGRDQQNLNADLQLAARGNLNEALRQHFPSVGRGDEAN